MKCIKRLIVSCLPLCTLLCIAALSFLSGCENLMDDHGPDAGGPTTFTATIDVGEPATRTLLDAASSAGRAVLWKAGDELIVGGSTYVAGSLSGDMKAATLTPKVETELAQLEGTVYKAYYPSAIYNGGTPTLPATQTYVAPSAADGNRVVASHFPMYAESSGTDLEFKNLCAVLNFQLTGTVKVTKVIVKSATKNLSGAFTVSLDSGGNPVLTMTGTASADKRVTLNCGTSGVQLNATTPVEFCVAVPAATYAQNDLTVEVYGTSSTTTPNTTFKNSASVSDFVRSSIYEVEKVVTGPAFRSAEIGYRQSFSSSWNSYLPTMYAGDGIVGQIFAVKVTYADGSADIIPASQCKWTPTYDQRLYVLSGGTTVVGNTEGSVTLTATFTDRYGKERTAKKTASVCYVRLSFVVKNKIFTPAETSPIIHDGRLDATICTRMTSSFGDYVSSESSGISVPSGWTLSAPYDIKTSGSNSLFSCWGSLSNINADTYKYVWIRFRLDDSTTATYPSPSGSFKRKLTRDKIPYAEGNYQNHANSRSPIVGTATLSF